MNNNDNSVSIEKYEKLSTVYTRIVTSLLLISSTLTVSFLFFQNWFDWIINFVPYDNYIASSLVIVTILLIALAYFTSQVNKLVKQLISEKQNKMFTELKHLSTAELEAMKKELT